MTRSYNESMYRCHSDIDPKKTYDTSELARIKAFWWIGDRRKYLEVIEQDRKLANVLEVETTGEGRGTRYMIKGSNIIKFYRLYGPGINLLKLK